MEQLRAFVGHSFSQVDELLVRQFLDYFDTLSQLPIGFTWEHAEDAEPTELSTKIHRLISDKNVFIGICTRKEAAIDPEQLKKYWFWKNKIVADHIAVKYKTSDWIIQEIGLAIGRNMQLVLLVEEGLRSPGGLQGNLEYIPFSREHPESSFPKILEMLNALRPRLGGIQAPGEPTPSIAASEEKSSPAGEDWAIPQSDWTRPDFERALMHCVLLDRDKEEQHIYDFYRGTDDAKKNSHLLTWEAYREYLKVFFDKDGSLATVEKFHLEHPDVSRLVFFTARCYRKFKDYERAGHLFRKAANLASSSSRKIELLGDAAQAFHEAGNPSTREAALAEVRTIVDQNPVPDCYEKALKAELGIAVAEGLDDVVAGCYEALVDLKPDDGSTRFNLAHKYGEMERGSLSLFHYSAIPRAKREAGTWNNLGVSYADQKLPVNAVKAYREAEKLNETLAMSNLALLFAGAGFLEEAEEICKKALRMENANKQVGTTYANVKGIEEKEAEQTKEILKGTRELRGFYKDFGLGSVRPLPAGVAGNWTTDRCQVMVDISGDKFSASGQYETGGGLIALAMLQPGLRGSPAKTKYEIKYRGRIRGASVLCDVTITEVGKTLTAGSLLTDTPKRAVLIVSNGGKTIKEFEKWIGSNSFSEWTKAD